MLLNVIEIIIEYIKEYLVILFVSELTYDWRSAMA